MNKKSKLTWWELKVGLLILTGLAILTIGVVLISGGGRLFKEKYLLKTYMPQVSGLKPGALVWLAGVEVGTVKEVKLIAVDSHTEVLVVMEIARDVQDKIKTDSVAKLATIGLLGDKYIEITPGSPGAPSLPPDGILQAEATSPLDQVAEESRSVLQKFDHLVVQLDTLIGKINAGAGTAGRLFTDAALYTSLHKTSDQLNQLLGRINRGEGTAGKLLSDDGLYADLSSSLQTADELGDKIKSGEGTLGKLASDPSLFDYLASASARLDTLLARLERGEGTLGDLARDKRIADDLHYLLADLRALINEVRTNPGKFLKFSIF